MTVARPDSSQPRRPPATQLEGVLLGEYDVQLGAQGRQPLVVGRRARRAAACSSASRASTRAELLVEAGHASCAPPAPRRSRLGLGPTPRVGVRSAVALTQRQVEVGSPALEVLVHAARQHRDLAVAEQRPDRVDDPLEEVAVVGDHDERARPAVEEVLEDVEGLDVEVVGGLVEEQHVGLGEQQPQQLEAAALATGQVAEPRGEPVAGEPEPLEHRRGGDLAVRGLGHPPDRLDRLAAPGPRGSRSSRCWVRCWSATVRPCLTLPTVGASSPDSSPRTEDLPGAVDPDDADPVARPEPPGRVRQQRSARRATRSTSSTSSTSLPSRWVANRWSSSRSRGGGTSSMSAFAASIRNFGLEVRAGGPRRSQASSLRTSCWRRTSEAAACRGALGLGEHERGVPALVGVDHAVVDLPGPLADRVEEPAVVGDDDQRRRPGRHVRGQPGDGLDVEVVGRLVEDDQVVAAEQQRGQRAAPALAAGQARRPRGRA